MLYRLMLLKSLSYLNKTDCNHLVQLHVQLSMPRLQRLVVGVDIPQPGKSLSAFTLVQYLQ